MYLQLSPFYEDKNTVEIYAGVIPLKFMFFLHTERENYYPHAHWVAGFNKYW